MTSHQLLSSQSSPFIGEKWLKSESGRISEFPALQPEVGFNNAIRFLSWPSFRCWPGNCPPSDFFGLSQQYLQLEKNKSSAFGVPNSLPRLIKRQRPDVRLLMSGNFCVTAPDRRVSFGNTLLLEFQERHFCPCQKVRWKMDFDGFLRSEKFVNSSLDTLALQSWRHFCFAIFSRDTPWRFGSLNQTSALQPLQLQLLMPNHQPIRETNRGNYRQISPKPNGEILSWNCSACKVLTFCGYATIAFFGKFLAQEKNHR